MLNSMRKHGTTLAVFAAVTTGLTAVVYTLTKGTIAHQAALQQKALLDQVVPPENYDNIMQNECLLVSDPALGDGAPHRLYLARKNGQPTAAALKPPRRTATPAPSSCWSAPISTARCSAPA